MRPLQIGFNAIGKPLSVRSETRRVHQHVIGSSGSGKSKFLEQMIRGDISAGQGFCLIDPHGTLYRDVLRYCAYFGVTREIVLLNLSEPDYINGFNFFEKGSDGGGDVAVQVDNRLKATLHAWNAENADSTPTLERVLRLVYTTMLDADLTLPQIAALLDYNEKEIRSKLIAKIENDIIRREWQELSDLPKSRDFRDEILSAKNRLFRLLTSKVLMRFLGVKGQTINLREAMDKQKIVLVNLAQSKNLSSENARLFGSLLVGQFFESALGRKKTPIGDNPKPYYLYLDEFQNFVSIDFCDMLDEVRKFGLFLILSHQRFGQLNEDIEDAVLTNCRIKTVFGGLRTDDARRMAEELFIGKVDPKKIKVAIYQTKHWYRYSRDKVYSKSVSHSETDGYSSGRGSGAGSGSASAAMTGQSSLPPSDDFFTGFNWLGDPTIKTVNEAETISFSEFESSSEFESESHSSGYSESEGEADIPVFVPVPYQELSSLQYYTPEEQILELTQALKLQQQRHCFVQLADEETQPLLVPFVKDYYVSPLNIKRYVKRLCKNALTPEEADRRISQSIENLLLLRNTANNDLNDELKESPDSPAETKPKRTTAPNKKRTIFDRLKADNSDLDLDS
jgi:hypothetical protein